MTGLGLVIILIALAGAVGLMTLVARLWSTGGSEVEPVGPLRTPLPRPPVVPIVPGKFRALITGEAENWSQYNQWLALSHQLDDIEVSLGGSPDGAAQPDKYSSQWLDNRLRRLEKLAGPLPAPLREPLQTQQPSRKRWFNK